MQEKRRASCRFGSRRIRVITCIQCKPLIRQSRRGSSPFLPTFYPFTRSCWMSIRLMSIVWELDIGQSQSKVLMVLCDHADDVPGQPGVGINCFPSLTKISWKTGYTRRGVQKVLDRLEKDELIV